MRRYDPTKREDIYFKKEELCRRSLERFHAWQGRPEDKEILTRYEQHLFATGAKNQRVSKVLAELRKVCEASTTPLTRFSKTDAEAYIAKLHRRTDLSEMTKSDYKRALKAFFRWYEDEDPRTDSEHSEERRKARKLYKYISQVKRPSKPKKVSYSDIITDEDARTLIDKGCNAPLEKALVAFLHETGVRVGELLGVRIKDVKRKEKHAMVRVDGKTGERRIPIVQSLPLILRWLDEHPYKELPESLLWVSKANRYHSKPLTYMGIRKLLTRVFQRAGVAKNNNPHHFRHSRATLIAPYYSEVILCQLMGWTLGSNMVKTYVHAGGQQTEKAVLETHGLQPQEQAPPTIKTCVCGAVNQAGARYCYKCGNALDVASFVEDEEKKKEAIDEAIEYMSRIMSDPSLRARFEEFKQQQEG